LPSYGLASDTARNAPQAGDCCSLNLNVIGKMMVGGMLQSAPDVGGLRTFFDRSMNRAAKKHFTSPRDKKR
jgi:hypothetical protein